MKSLKFRCVVLALAMTMVASSLLQIGSYRVAHLTGEIGKRDARVRDVPAAVASLPSG